MIETQAIPLTTNNNQRLNCLQINLRHSKAASANLSQLLIDLNIDVALIQEPYAYCHAEQITVANVPNGYTAVHELDVMHAYGAAIVVKDTLKPIRPSLAANHTIGVHLLTHKPALTFFSLYARPSSPKLLPFFEPFKSLPSAVTKNIVIAADINGRSPLWNSATTDNKGREFEDFLTTTSLNLLNVMNSNLQYVPTKSSFVDVTVGGDDIRVFSWKFLTIDSMSDHPLIFFQIECPNRAGNRSNMRRSPNIKRIDHPSFLCHLKDKLASNPIPDILNSQDEIDEAVEKLTNTILHCANANKIKTRIESKPNKMNWWSKKLWGIRNRLRVAMKLQHQDELCLLAYKKLKAEYQREIRTHKKKAHQKFCTENINRDLFGSLKTFSLTNNSNSDFPLSVLDQREIKTNKSDILQCFAASFFPWEKDLGERKRETLEEVEVEMGGQPDSVHMICLEDLQRLSLILERTLRREWTLSAELLHLCAEVVSGELLAILNSCLRLGFFPTSWKEARVCIARKPKKDSYQDVKSYRLLAY